MRNTAIIRIHCPDQRGIVAKVTDFIHRHNGNVLALDQHTDQGEKRFFMRVEWDLDGFSLSVDEIKETFKAEIATPMSMIWSLKLSDQISRMALFVSRASHCLFDLLARHQAGELKVEIPLIVSNHKDLEKVANQFGIPFHHLPVTKETKEQVEAEQNRLLEAYAIDFIVLARYMQILSSDFIERYPNRIINIHHSFLPAFAGAKPYHAAHSRGVKIIGATGHYVTSELDAGPIIDQDTIRISHHDSVESLVQKGKDIEKLVLSRAVRAHVDRKTLVYKNKTIIFA
ncbi:MAG: formyltetrahydrofolate deformylase [Marinilabiliaceae bacterium]|nr:formyltetrahydrofolate deformylase [Marinilabiliaceae bacterium]